MHKKLVQVTKYFVSNTFCKMILISFNIVIISVVNDVAISFDTVSVPKHDITVSTTDRRQQTGQDDK